MKPGHPEANCPVLPVLERIANKWAVLVVAALRKQPPKFTAAQIQ